MNNYCVYLHLKSDDLSPFYVGKGKRRRAFTRSERSAFWRRVAEKHGFTVKILREDMSEDDAFLLEKSLISFIGRRDLGTGPLVNHTDGAEGSSGYRHTQSAKKKISDASKMMSAESRAIGAAKRAGRKDSDEVRLKKSISSIGNDRTRKSGPRCGGFKGVSFNKKLGKWLAKITVNYEQKYLGLYEDQADAARAYDRAAVAAWGEDCYINLPDELTKDRS